MGLIRTNLANERTLLAYARTALAFLAAGAGMIHFFQSLIMNYTGGSLLAVGSAIFLIGTIRFVKVKRLVSTQPSKAALQREQ